MPSNQSKFTLSDTQFTQSLPAMSELKNRKTDTKKSDSSPSSKNLVELNPDFVFKIDFPVDVTTLKPKQDSSVNLAKLLKSFELNKFTVEIRPDTSIHNLLVFVKLNDFQFLELLKLSKNLDFIFGVISQDDLDKIDYNELIKTISPADKSRIIYEYLVNDDDGLKLQINNGDWKFIKDIIPSSNFELIKKESNYAVNNIFKIFSSDLETHQSDFLFKNYGSSYAFYNIFQLDYLNSLIVLSFLGLIANSIFGRYSIIFTIINCFWSSGFYIYWNFKEKSLSNLWNLKNVDKIKKFNLLKKNSEKKVNSILPSVDNSITLLKQFAFVPIAIGFIVTLIFYQLSCFVLEIFINEIYEGPLKSILSLIPTVLVCAIVPIVTIVYTMIVNKYLDFEKNSTNNEKSNSFLIKIFTLNFFANYMALIITAFIYLPLGYRLNKYLQHVNYIINGYTINYLPFINSIPIKQSDYEVNKLRLNDQFKYFIITNQIIGLILEFVVPVILPLILDLKIVKSLLNSNKMKEESKYEIKLNDSKEETEFLNEVRSNFNKPLFDLNAEYRQIINQFGYLSLFGPIWPVGSIPSIIITIIQYKLDYIKFLKNSKNSIPSRTNTITPWTNFIKFLSLTGTVISSLITMMYKGGDLITSINKTSVKFDWYIIILFSLVNFLVFKFLINSSEIITTSYFNNDASIIELKLNFIKDKKFNLSLLNPPMVDAVKTSNEKSVDELLESANLLPSKIAKLKK